MKKALMTLSLLCATTSCFAVECGPSVTTATLDKWEETVRSRGAVLDEHSMVLIERSMAINLRAMSTGGRNDAELHRLEMETTVLSGIVTMSDGVEAALSTASAVAAVRDAMLDRRDTERANKFLSLHLATVRKTASVALKRMNTALRKITLPGVAIDASKLRDAIEAIVQEFGRCEATAVPASR